MFSAWIVFQTLERLLGLKVGAHGGKWSKAPRAEGRGTRRNGQRPLTDTRAIRRRNVANLLGSLGTVQKRGHFSFCLTFLDVE